MADAFVVIVTHNLVCAIEKAADAPSTEIARTPLEAGTRLAANHRERGCIDGRYYFIDTMHARTFAELCLEFTRALAERRIGEVRALPVGNPEYHAEPAAPAD